MNQLKKRARAEEAVFASRQTQEFLAHSRSLHRLGEWAATQMMGKEAPAITTYAEALVRSGIAGADVQQSVKQDLHNAGLAPSANDVDSQFEIYLAEARRQAQL
jgi:hypothetical protein